MLVAACQEVAGPSEGERMPVKEFEDTLPQFARKGGVGEGVEQPCGVFRREILLEEDSFGR